MKVGEVLQLKQSRRCVDGTLSLMVMSILQNSKLALWFHPSTNANSLYLKTEAGCSSTMVRAITATLNLAKIKCQPVTMSIHLGDYIE